MAIHGAVGFLVDHMPAALRLVAATTAMFVRLGKNRVEDEQGRVA